MLGVVAGVVWKLVTPVVRLPRVAGGLELDETSGARLFAAEGWFAVLALVGGAVLGIVAVVLAARVGWPVVPLAAVAALGAGVLAWRVGVALAGHPRAPTGPVAVPLTLSGHSVLALWPLATALVSVLAALIRPGWFDRPG